MCAWIEIKRPTWPYLRRRVRLVGSNKPSLCLPLSCRRPNPSLECAWKGRSRRACDRLRLAPTLFCYCVLVCVFYWGELARVVHVSLWFIPRAPGCEGKKFIQITRRAGFSITARKKKRDSDFDYLAFFLSWSRSQQAADRNSLPAIDFIFNSRRHPGEFPLDASHKRPALNSKTQPLVTLIGFNILRLYLLINDQK